MDSLFLRGSFLRKILRLGACVMAFASVQTPAALAQRGGHVGGARVGGGHVGAPRGFLPPASRATISRPRISAGPRGLGVGTASFRPRFPVGTFRRRAFFRGPFFGPFFGFNSFFLAGCGPYFGWGFDCGGLPFYGTGFENYVTFPQYESVPYEYGLEEAPPLVWLYLKDGTVYYVGDYWFVKDQVHFTSFEEGGGRSVERVIGLDELDVLKTIDVNTRRGFRVVMRDEPLQQYMRDRPDEIPPPLESPKQ